MWTIWTNWLSKYFKAFYETHQLRFIDKNHVKNRSSLPWWCPTFSETYEDNIHDCSFVNYQMINRQFKRPPISYSKILCIYKELFWQEILEMICILIEENKGVVVGSGQSQSYVIILLIRTQLFFYKFNSISHVSDE